MSDTQQPSPADGAPAVATLSYEAARDELVTIVSRLESGQLGLEESMTLWERGEALADHCTRWLDGAQSRLNRAETEEDEATDAADVLGVVEIDSPQAADES